MRAAPAHCFFLVSSHNRQLCRAGDFGHVAAQKHLAALQSSPIIPAETFRTAALLELAPRCGYLLRAPAFLHFFQRRGHVVWHGSAGQFDCAARFRDATNYRKSAGEGRSAVPWLAQYQLSPSTTGCDASSYGRSRQWRSTGQADADPSPSIYRRRAFSGGGYAPRVEPLHSYWRSSGIGGPDRGGNRFARRRSAGLDRVIPCPPAIV